MRLKNIKPASLALMLLALGSFSSCIHYSGQSGSDKLSSLLYVIGHQYVDTVDMDELVEKTIPKVLSELDPHSAYVTAEACAQGLGSCILGWFDDDKIRKICDLEHPVRLVITLGYAAENDLLRPKKRKDTQELIKYK